MNIMLSGSSGLVGSGLQASLLKDGHTVHRLGRSYVDKLDFKKIDAVIHLAGESIADGRWNAAKKKRIEESRVIGTSQLAQQINDSEYKPKVFISASAIGFYGNRGDEIIDEQSVAGNDFLSSVCLKWEAATEAAVKSGVRTVNLRTGVVLSTKGGALQKMLPPFKFGAGGILGSGKQYMSWISLDDMIGSISYILNNDSIQGPINLVSPNPVTNAEFTKILGKVLHRPTFMPLPSFAARLIFGEMADALLLCSTRVLPNKLKKAGYSFKHENLQSALEDIIE